MTIHDDPAAAAVGRLAHPLEAATRAHDQPAPHRVNDYTLPGWATETASAAAFDTAIGDDYWTIYREVTGILTQPRPHQIDKTVRIDRVLTPRPALIQAGWTHGVIGVEIKRSREKIGPAIAQAIDYSRSVWTLHNAGNSRVWLDWVFIWPMPKQGGALASVLAQNRIGTATPSYGGGVHLKSGEAAIAYVGGTDGLHLATAPHAGAKVGRR